MDFALLGECHHEVLLYSNFVVFVVCAVLCSFLFIKPAMGNVNDLQTEKQDSV
jgi:hypothetical protein